MTDDGDQLPRGLDLLWGRRPRARRGPKPALELDAIVDAAMRVADADGLDAVSMARVASELGYTAMSLYRHVDSKAELLLLMWNASAAGASAITGTDWRSKLESWSGGQREALLRRPWILQMPMSTPPAGPSSLAWVEQAMAALDGLGLNAAERLGVISLISSYNLSEARQTHDESSARDHGAADFDYAKLVRMVADEAIYPSLHRAAWSGELDNTTGATAADGYRFGLERILDGVQVLIERRQREASPTSIKE